MPAKYLDPLHRLAIVTAHQWKCVICLEPITGEFDIDHMIPKEMAQINRKDELAALCARLHRPGFDISGLQNLGPAHKSCNNRKGTTVYTDTILHERLLFIESKMPAVEQYVANWRISRAFEKAMLFIMAAIGAGKTSGAAVNARLAEIAHTESPPTPDYAVAWTPMALDSLKRRGASIELIEDALVFAVQRGEMKFDPNPALSDDWVLRFRVSGEPWRAFVTLDNGLLLITRVVARKDLR